MLIVCEGAKTEPHYFEALRNDLKLNNANIVVTGDCGSDPMSVVNYAKELFKQDSDYDRVYCVIDRDQHPNYQAALTKLSGLKPGNIFLAITSVPCFEYWLLLHFEDTTKPYSPTGQRSSCGSVIADLKAHLPDYGKGKRDTYQATQEFLDDAKDRADKNRKAVFASGTDNPHTKVDELVDYLQNIKT